MQKSQTTSRKHFSYCMVELRQARRRICADPPCRLPYAMLCYAHDKSLHNSGLTGKVRGALAVRSRPCVTVAPLILPVSHQL